MSPLGRAIRGCRSKLACRFSLVILMIIVTMGGIIFLVVDTVISRDLYDSFSQKGVAIVSNLAANAVDPLLLDNVVRLELLLKNSEKNVKEIEYLFILDAKGRVAAHTFPAGFPRDLRRVNIPQKGQPFSSQLLATEKGTILDIAVPVLHGDLGSVHAGFSYATVEKKRWHAQQIVLWTCLLSGLVAVVCSMVFSRYLTKPLAALVRGAESLGQGDLAHRVAIVGQDEIGVVAKAFNRMAASLQEDVAKRIATEKALAAEKERLSVTLRSIGDGVITTDIAGRIILVNKVAESLTDWTQEEANGRPLEEVFCLGNDHGNRPVESPVKKVIDSGQVVEIVNQAILIGKNNRQRCIAASAGPIRDSEGVLLGIVLVFRDVTERIQTERELLKMEKLESLGVLAGGIAHDFNNILAVILGNIDLSLLDQDLNDMTKKFLNDAAKAIIRAKGLTQQLLTFAKGGEPVKETASLAQVVRDSANFVVSGLPVTVQYDIPADLWLAEIDKVQFSQVIQNIVINAGQAMLDGGVVKITCRNVDSFSDSEMHPAGAGKFVKITIHDQGAGIPADIVDRIFDPFFSTRQQGSGLGLAITHSIITKHGGRISVESEPGAGSTFIIYLPAVTEQRIQPARTAAVPTETAKKARILVMDDDEMVRKVAEAILRQEGHDVLLAKDGAEAIQIFKEAVEQGRPLDIAILDLTIPGGMGGKETAREILAINPGARLLVSSGYSNDPIMANYGENGFFASVEKPYQMQELITVINQILTA